MKTKYLTTALLATGLTFITSCGEKKDTHAGHDHAKGEEHHDEHEGHDHADGDHDDHDGHDHSDHHGHDHVQAGPNGGRMIEDTNAEFFVTPDRTIKITFFDAEKNPITPTTQEVVVVSRAPSAPVEFTFKINGNHFISTEKVPAGNNHPTAVQIKATPQAEPKESRFNLNLSDCPTCDNLEYACECHH